MDKPTKQLKFHLVRLFTAFIALAAGLLFSLSIINNGGATNRVRSHDLRSAVRAETQAVQKAQNINRELQAEIAKQDKSTFKQSNLSAEDELLLADKQVTGPGVVIQLTDSQNIEPDLNPDIFVVHQQDVEAVMNALWRGGAEAMTVQDSRVTLTSNVRCVGNVIYVNGEVFSPPFKIAAIGDPESLLSALRSDETMKIYQQYVRRYGLGYKEQVNDKMVFPAENKKPEFQVLTTVEAS